MSSSVARLRALLAHETKIVVCPGVYDGLTARIALKAGFDALYMVNNCRLALIYVSTLVANIRKDRSRNNGKSSGSARPRSHHSDRNAAKRRDDRQSGPLGVFDRRCRHRLWR